LQPNYPNPFNPSTTIAFSLPETQRVRLTVVNLLGETVAILVDAPLAEGKHTVPWNAAFLPSGIYLCRLQAGAQVQTTKMVLMK